jgi:hypothetical protein
VALNGRKWQAIEKCVLPASYPRHKLMAAAVQAGSSRLTIAPSRMLFEFSSPLVVPGSNIFAYSPAPDGQGFLATVLSSGQEATLNVITNWEKAAGSRRKSRDAPALKRNPTARGGLRSDTEGTDRELPEPHAATASPIRTVRRDIVRGEC